ncbi:hypothetical protein U5801_20150 [Lamprobacter modestohalophilus]|uniref:hypothetical protein n=1 Tax=Lamprobacter modestohalophilus TaxID=1064514 RepID=UPI002ADEE24E|nr:hypothetical protein [Lamprobacter modestohalophilus]MEA1052101.1 hypothetical protein [Lamprobacter modestohalophilus]
MTMTQTNLFSWDAIEARSDLDRLQLAIDHLPDERLVQYLEVMRQQGRNDYPVRPMWNALLAGIVFQHASIELLARACPQSQPHGGLRLRPAADSAASPSPGS